MAKIRLIIEGEYDLEESNYENVYDADGSVVELNKEQREALTEQQMLEYDLRFIKHGELSVDDIIGCFDEFDTKLELVEE